MRVSLSIPLAAALVAAPLSAQEAYGGACAGASGLLPGLDASQPLTAPGWQVTLSGAPSTAGLLLVGASDAFGLGFELPLDLGALVPGLPGCQLLASPDLLIPATTGSDGQAILGFDTSSLPVGSVLFLQHWSLDTDLVAVPQLLGGFSGGLRAEFIAPSGVEPGDLVITEFMKDPSFSSDSSGEWLELENRGESDLDLRGWTLADDGFDSLVLTSDTPILAPAGERIVLGNGDPSGVGVDHVYAGAPGQFNLGNGADEIVLTTFDGIEVDRVAYDAGVLWADPSGASLALLPGLTDPELANDDPASWFVPDCVIGGAPYNMDHGTPGEPNLDCGPERLPTGSGALVLTEIMANPATVSDAFGEYLEFTNPGALPVDVSGWTVCTMSICAELGDLPPVPPGGRLLLAADDDPALNGGLPGGTVPLDPSQFLSNGGGSIQLIDAAGTLVSLVPFGGSAGLPSIGGAAWQLDPQATTALDSQDPSNWCLSGVPFGAGDLGTPGAANDSCP